MLIPPELDQLSEDWMLATKDLSGLVATLSCECSVMFLPCHYYAPALPGCRTRTRINFSRHPLSGLWLQKMTQDLETATVHQQVTG